MLQAPKKLVAIISKKLRSKTRRILPSSSDVMIPPGSLPLPMGLPGLPALHNCDPLRDMLAFQPTRKLKFCCNRREHQRCKVHFIFHLAARFGTVQFPPLSASMRVDNKIKDRYSTFRSTRRAGGGEESEAIDEYRHPTFCR